MLGGYDTVRQSVQQVKVELWHAASRDVVRPLGDAGRSTTALDVDVSGGPDAQAAPALLLSRRVSGQSVLNVVT